MIRANFGGNTADSWCNRKALFDVWLDADRGKLSEPMLRRFDNTDWQKIPLIEPGQT